MLVGIAGLSVVLQKVPAAQSAEATPSARIVSASRLAMPGAVDSNVPMTWELVDGVWRLYALTSWGGVPALSSGSRLEQMNRELDAVDIVPPRAGVWIDSIIADEAGSWYGYYHHEITADVCDRPDRFIPRIAAAKSIDRGRTWVDLGIVLEAPPDSHSCTSNNRFVLGGVGDLTAMLSDDKQDLYIFFSQYSKDRNAQGVAAARMAWADRDAPVGAFAVWQDGTWIPPRPVEADTDQELEQWEYPAGTPLVPVTKPWHDGDPAADAYWGPSIHWNTHLQQYVTLLNRTKDEAFNNDGIYVSYSRTLADPASWSTPRKLMSGGGWYPQVAGLETGTGTDKHAGQRARLFLTGKSEHAIEFSR